MSSASDAHLFPDWLTRRARISPAKTAIVCDREHLTFAELDADAGAVASNLERAGISPQDRVALLAPNGLEFARLLFGIARLGAVLVPVNTRLTSDEIRWQLEDSAPALLVTGETLDPAYSAAARVAPLSELVAPSDALPLSADKSPSDLSSIIYTSGTGGRPKGALLTYGNFLWNAFGSATHLGLHEDDRWLACMPLFHVGGLSILIRGVLYGMTVEVHQSFEPDRVVHALTKGEVTIVSLVPTMLDRLLELHPGRFHPNLRCVLLGGGPSSPELLDECLRRGIPVAPTYGLTEAASQVATMHPREVADRPGASGTPLLPVRLRIEGDGGAQCEPGEAGEIVISGPTVTSGYFRRPKETADSLRGGWFHTGDFGYLDARGYLFVLDRRDDLIVSGGENVYPAEVEAVLTSHPSVAEAAVFALPDRQWGQSVAAAVTLRAGAVADAEGLRSYCRSRLAAFKTPKLVRFLPALPRNASGKLLRRELRTMFESEAGSA